MIRFYGNDNEDIIERMRIGGICPYCREKTRFSLVSVHDGSIVIEDGLTEVVAGYSCDGCLRAIPILWEARDNGKREVFVSYPRQVLKSLEHFDFEYVPDQIKKEITEALRCYSVNAFNGFAALSRRAIQAISMNLGEKGTDKVKDQITNIIAEEGLDEEWQMLASEIILSGHDGAHPHLPEVDKDRAEVLLVLLQTLTYQLYTRKGKIQHSKGLRREAIEKRKSV